MTPEQLKALGDAYERIRWTELHHVDLEMPEGRLALTAQLADLETPELEAIWISLESQVRLLEESPAEQAWVKGGWRPDRVMRKLGPALRAAQDALEARAAGIKLEDPTEVRGRMPISSAREFNSFRVR